MALSFRQLNRSWNAEPNAPDVRFAARDGIVEVSFRLNHYQFADGTPGERATLRFVDCLRYRHDPTNDEGWYRGEGRYARAAPAWGEFYEIAGDDDREPEPGDWIETGVRAGSSVLRHFLFYFRDEAFECLARSCQVDRAGQATVNL